MRTVFISGVIGTLARASATDKSKSKNTVTNARAQNSRIYDLLEQQEFYRIQDSNGPIYTTASKGECRTLERDITSCGSQRDTSGLQLAAYAAKEYECLYSLHLHPPLYTPHLHNTTEHKGKPHCRPCQGRPSHSIAKATATHCISRRYTV